MTDFHVARRQVRLLYIITFIILAFQAYSINNTNAQAYTACKHTRDVQAYAVLTIQRSEKTLPTIAYYKNPDHKAELATQLAILKESEKDFTPIHCTRKLI